MADRFGMSHRQQIRDVNAGKVSPKTPDAVKGRRSGAQYRATDRTAGVNLPDGSKLVRDALIRAAGVAGDVITREHKRKQALEGAIMAGTEEGRQAIQEEKDTLANKIFGPNAKIRSAEERIVKDEVDNASIKLEKDLVEFGHQMSPGDWKAHVTTALEQMTSKYSDEDLKDKITTHFGANAGALSREYEKKRELYVQQEERNTFIDSATKGAEMAQLDLDSQDPQREQDAKGRLTAAVHQPAGMSDSAYQSALASVVKNELSQNRVALYEHAQALNLFDGMEWEDKVEIQQAHDMYKAATDTEGMVALQELSALADKGDIAAVRKSGPALMAQYPHLFGKSGLQKYIQVAWDAATELAADNRKATTAKRMATVGDGRLHSDFTKQERTDAVEAMVVDGATARLRTAHKEEAQRNGERYDPNAPISDVQIQQELLKSVEQWGPRYFDNSTVAPVVKRAINRVAFDLRNPDLPPERLEEVGANVQQLMKLREMDRFGFSEHVDKSDATKLTAAAEMLNAGKSVREVWKVLHPETEVKPRKLSKEESEQAGIISGKLARDFEEKYLDQRTVLGMNWMTEDLHEYSRTDLQNRLQAATEEGMQMYGDSFMAEAHAQNTVIDQAVVQGNQIVFDGKFLNTPAVSWDRYLRGWEEDPAMQQMLRDAGVSNEVRLRDGRTVPDGSGEKGATIYLPWADPDKPGEYALRVDLPTTQEQIRPTSGFGFGEHAEPVEGVDFDAGADVNRYDEHSYEGNNASNPLSLFVAPAGAAPGDGAPSGDVFRTTLAAVENSVKAGYDKATQRWKPHTSPEGGTDTLAFGHKLTAEEARTGKVMIGGKAVDITEGLTDEQAWKLLDQDIETHTKRVRKSVRDFDKLPEKYQNVLVNISFNAGSVSESKWPKLLAAMRSGDDRAVRREMVTSFTDSKGKRRQLKQRATDIANAVGLEGN